MEKGFLGRCHLDALLYQHRQDNLFRLWCDIQLQQAIYDLSYISNSFFCVSLQKIPLDPNHLPLELSGDALYLGHSRLLLL
jgi:hypothetical protein